MIGRSHKEADFRKNDGPGSLVPSLKVSMGAPKCAVIRETGETAPMTFGLEG